MATFANYGMRETKLLLRHNLRENTHHKNKNIKEELREKNQILYGVEDYKEALETLRILEQNVWHAKRKDWRESMGYIITYPEMPMNEEEEKEFQRLVIEQLKEAFSEKNILSVVVHKDENRPHIHAVCLPIKWDEPDCIPKFKGSNFLGVKDLKNWGRTLQQRINKNKTLGKIFIIDKNTKENRKKEREMMKTR